MILTGSAWLSTDKHGNITYILYQGEPSPSRFPGAGAYAALNLTLGKGVQHPQAVNPLIILPGSL